MNISGINVTIDPYQGVEIDESKVVMITPHQIEDLNIGFDMTLFGPLDYDNKFPVFYDAIIYYAKKNLLGESNSKKSSLVHVEGSDCVVGHYIKINKKLFLLREDEDNPTLIDKDKQIKIFQRLLSEGKITMEDLAAEDIDNDVYKELVVNSITGVDRYNQVKEFLDNLLSKQKNDTSFIKMQEFLKTI